MKNKRIATLLIYSLLTVNLFTALSPCTVSAESALTIKEGSHISPNIEIIRGNDDETVSGQESVKAAGDLSVSASMTYEDDLSGYGADTVSSGMTTVYISTADDLTRLAKSCSLDTWSKDKNVVLKEDIILDGSDFKYIPIFGGIFDGKGHTIYGLNITSGESYTGLFCVTQSSALIRDLTVNGSLLPSGRQLATGGIVGDNYGVIENCTFDGTIDGYDYSGGIAGYNENSGVINNCRSKGYVSGMHFTGGITGYNLGTVNNSINDSLVNMSYKDTTISVKDIDMDKYANKLLNLFGDNNKQDSTNVINSTVDVGGICGYSQGQISGCTNNALVGYEHVGYNVGGICGRQNGYIFGCSNNGSVYGRKDVGGIVGQAEPYVVIDITDDMIGQLTSNMDTLHDLVNNTLNDAGDESSLINARLNMVKSFTDKALDDTSYLANETEDLINGIMDSSDELINRIDYAMSESVKSNGAIDKLADASSKMSKAATNLTHALDDLDIRSYLTPEETVSYNNARDNIQKAVDDYNAYIDRYRESDHRYEYLKYINSFHDSPSLRSGSSALVPLDSEGNELSWPSVISGNKADYENIDKIVRRDSSKDPVEYPDFPTVSGDFADADKELDQSASAYADARVRTLAGEEFRKNYGVSYAEYLENNLAVIASIVMAHEKEMSEDTRRDLKYALDYTGDSINSFSGAVKETGSIIKNLSDRSSITFPRLSDEYKLRSNSLVANIQGMSDNLGYLNNEMDSSNQKLVDDMMSVNDQFNVIMLLIADAIDGVLDNDYTDVYEDDSLAVANDCTDATVADSLNRGDIHGDINTAGIAGTMAIEYDFDLESDVTGIKEAVKGTTYRTKCVMRRDTNEGRVNGLKDCVGGISGRQEMGTILHCQNYGRLSSNSGDYVGGIAGESLATIHSSYAKEIMHGRNYIGGITGHGYDIRGCVTLPSIISEGTYLGAVAGDNDTDGRIYDNYFVSDKLAGIGRVSYSGKAEPVSYAELMKMQDIPDGFKYMNVSYILDDEIVSNSRYAYGDTVKAEDHPAPGELPEDKYAKWNTTGDITVHSDIEITGESARYLTTLAGMQQRNSGQSCVLADGRFIDTDELACELNTSSTAEGILETWTIDIPDDGQASHLIRYCKPDDIGAVKLIWADRDDDEIETQSMGRYLTFEATGNRVSFSVEELPANPLIRYWRYEAAGVALLLAILAAVHHGLNRKRNKHDKKHNKHGNAKRKHDTTASENADDIVFIEL